MFLSIFGILIFSVLYGFMNLVPSNDSLILKRDQLLLELGETYELKVADVLDNPNRDIQTKAKLQIGDVTSKNKDDKLILNTKAYSVGSYLGKVTYQNELLEFTFKIEDTQAPKFKKFEDKIVIEQSALDVDLKNYFDVKDYSPFKVTIENEKDIKLDSVGVYATTLVAKDNHGNSEEKKVSIKVVSLKDAAKYGVTAMKNGKKPMSEAMIAYQTSLNDNFKDSDISMAFDQTKLDAFMSSDMYKQLETNRINISKEGIDSQDSWGNNTSNLPNTKPEEAKPAPTPEPQPEIPAPEIPPAPEPEDLGQDKVGNTGVWHGTWNAAFGYAQGLRWNVYSQWFGHNYTILYYAGYGYTVNFK